MTKKVNEASEFKKDSDSCIDLLDLERYSESFVELKTPPPSSLLRDEKVHDETKLIGASRMMHLLCLQDLYPFTTLKDTISLSMAIILATINGAMYPLMALIFGKAIEAFQHTSELLVDRKEVGEAALYYLYIALGLLLTDFVAYILFASTAETQTKRLRESALRHMLHLDIAWYDAQDPYQLCSRIISDTEKMKDGMEVKLGDAFRYTSQTIVGYVIGFAKSWEISLVMACLTPIMACSLAYIMKYIRTGAVQTQKLYAEAGSVAEETLGFIRTIQSINAEHVAIKKYDEKLKVVEAAAIKAAKPLSMVFGSFLGCMWLMYAIGLWYGGHKVSQGSLSPSTVFQAFYGILLGTMSLGHIAPSIRAVAEAKGSAVAIHEILDTDGDIDAHLDDGIIIQSCRGTVQITNVYFSYPIRPSSLVLKNFNVTIECGRCVAFVGASGGGKSTLIALIERFYDPLCGRITLDGHDVKTLQLRWLRSQIGIVSQEPVLFAGTIYENIAGGLERITRDEVVAAAKLANAHAFIMNLPGRYDTMITDKGICLSGGQKQRIAIARAIARKPKILILDEATSALDMQSEREVQTALNHLLYKIKMTTIIIAHRLSTVRHADKIVVVEDGAVAEEGSHDELMQYTHGIYRSLYTKQHVLVAQEEMTCEKQPCSTTSITTCEVSSRISQNEEDASKSRLSASAATTHTISSQAIPDSISRRDIFQLIRPEQGPFIIGLCSVIISGLGFPISAVLISAVISEMTNKYAMYRKTGDVMHLDNLSEIVLEYGSIYVTGAIVIAIAGAIQSYAFRYLQERLTARLRAKYFGALCRQNIAFFDELRNSVGTLTSDLCLHVTRIAMISGECQGRLAQAVVTLAAGLIISFTTGSWLLTLILLAVLPFLIAGQYVKVRQVRKVVRTSGELSLAGALVSQAVTNIHTLKALGMEDAILDKFLISLHKLAADGNQNAGISGLALGMSSFILYATYSVVFWYGGMLVDEGSITFYQLMRTMMAILITSDGVGIAASYLGDTESAIKSAEAMCTLLKRPLPIDSFDQVGEKPDKVKGSIEFKDVTFRYPSRKEVTVLDRFHLTIPAEKIVALCGPSGGGKSTCIALLERFYDTTTGQVLLDGIDIKTLNVTWLRSQIGLVGQEPTLFIGTIAENIAYGMDEHVSRDQIIAAAKVANAHDFISQFAEGYDTQVGSKGDQLSGGQKQRIAIARAILLDPKILLLDEGTSALDPKSEQLVQKALEGVMTSRRRTTIIVAHRLLSIRCAHQICFIRGGRIIEQGTYEELMKKNGAFVDLARSSVS